MPFADDQELWLRFRNGDEEAFSALARQHYRKFLHYGLKFTANIPLIEDAIQDLLINLWLHRNRINDTPSVTFYLLKSFRHQLFKTLKRFNYQELDVEFENANTDSSTEDVLIQQETDQIFEHIVASVIAQLPARQKEVIYLRFYQGLRPEEIADLLAIKPQSVSNILQRALSSLRERWPIVLLCYVTFFHHL